MKISTKLNLPLSKNFKRFFAATLVMLFCSGLQAQTQLAAWSFESSTTLAVTPAEYGVFMTSSNIYANGTNGSSSFAGGELGNFTGSTINDPKVTPNNSFSFAPTLIAASNTNGKGFVIKVPMTGYQKPIVTLATRGTATGFDQAWSYSTNGSTFTPFTTITGLTTSFVLKTIDFSTVSALDNVPFMYIKVTLSGASGTNQNNRFDNIVIKATALAVAPVVTPSSFSGTVGTAFSQNIIASNSPTSYAIVSGTLPAGLSLNTTSGLISGTPTAAGSATISVTAANGSGTSSPANIDITIAKADQTISFGPLSNVTYGVSPITLTGTTSSGLPITYSTSNPVIATVSGNTLTILRAGSVNIIADQAGNANYNAATTVIVPLTINKADQVITFNALPDKTSSDADFALTATSTSGLAISYSSSNTGVITISGSTAHIAGAGNTIITASQAGNVNYNPAVSVTQGQYVSNAALTDQTITFNPLADVTYGVSPFALTATASSGLPVSYSSSNTSIATISGNTITILAPGSVTITASQSGNGTYNPAPFETQNLNILTKNLTISGVIANDKTYDGTTGATLNLSGASLTGVVGSDVVNFSGTGVFASANAGAGIVVNTNFVLTGANAGKYTLTQPSLTASILKANQTITFASLPGKLTTDAPFALTGSSTSGLSVSYASSNTAVATVSGNTVTIVGAGTTSITASQAGNTNYNAATDVSQNLVVTAPPTIDMLAAWTFDDLLAAPNTLKIIPANLGVNASTSNIYADGSNGSSNWASTSSNPQLTAFGGSVNNDPRTTRVAGNSLTTANTSANGQSIVFKISLSGYANPILTYTTQKTTTGFDTQAWSYSTDGINFTALTSVTPPSSFSTTPVTIDFSSINSLDNAANVYFKVTFTGASATAGNNRLDNFVIRAEQLPPATPVVTGGSFSGVVGTALSYNIVAANVPTSYAIASGTLPAGLDLNTTTGEISGTPTAAGSVTISVTATNSAGTSAPADINITIDKADQIITFGPLANATYGDASITLTGTTSSGLPITYSTSNPLIASVSGNVLTILRAGSVNIIADQEGNENYNAAPTVIASLLINKADQEITFAPLADKASDDPDFALTATSTSGLPVTYSSSNTGVITISGSTAHIEGPGNSTITASQAGNVNYNPAVAVDQNQFVTNAALTDQTITFNALSDVNYGAAPFSLSATATSGLPVTYTSSDESVATVSGNTVTIVGAGSTSITASQAGNGTYNPAPDVVQNLNVLPKDLSITGIVANDKTYDGTTDVTLDLSGATLVGVVGSDDVTFNGTAAFADANAASGVAVTTNFVLTGADANNYTLTQPILSANILKADQTITFGAIPNKTTNDAPFELDATSTSGLAVTYTSSDPLVATVSGTTVTIVGAGSTTITASQGGNLNYNPATDVDQSLTVVVAPVIVTWNFGTTSANPAPSSGTPVNNLIISDYSRGNNLNPSQDFLSTTSPSSGSGLSGQYNAGAVAANETFGLETSAYFEFSLTPAPGYSVTLNDLSFGERSTSSGPTTLSIRTSADNFAANVATISRAANSAWVLYSPSITAITSTQPLVVRIYGSVTGGAGTVTASSSVNFRIDDVSINVIVEALPACSGTPTAGTASADQNAFCLSGSTNINLTGNSSSDEFQGITTQWYSSTDNVTFTPISGANSATLATGTITETTYYYNVVSCEGSGLSATSNTVTVLVSALPTATITGNSSYCSGGSTVLTASAGTSYDWKRDGNSFASTQSVTVNQAGSYTVTVTNENNCSATSSALVVTEIPAATAPVISGIVNVCTYVGTGEQLTYTLVPIPGATSYNWTVPPAATIVSGQGTESITITLRSDFASFVNKQIRATANTACGVGPIGIFYMAAQSPITPRPITGPTDVCPYFNNSLEATYSIDPVLAASSYLWTVPAGVTITQNLGTSIKVTFGPAFTTSAITVRSVNGCGTSGARSININRSLPSAPGIISGPGSVCLLIANIGNPSGTNGIYIVNRTAPDLVYTWSVPVGATIVSHTTTETEDQIEVSFTSEYNSGDISVVASNNCGTSLPRIFKLAKLNPVSPGAITENRIGNCPERTFEYSLVSNPGGSSYILWTVPTGGTILSGQGTTSITVSYSNQAISGNVSVSSVNGCRTSVPRNLAVKIPACAPGFMTKTTDLNIGVELEILNASIFPNPSTSSFRLKVNSSAKESIQVNIYDVTGRKRQAIKLLSGEVTTFGDNLKAGTYMVEVIQGNERKVSKIVKL